MKGSSDNAQRVGKARIWSRAEVEALEGYSSMLMELLEDAQVGIPGVEVPSWSDYLIEYLSEELKNLESQPTCYAAASGQMGSSAYGNRSVQSGRNRRHNSQTT